MKLTFPSEYYTNCVLLWAISNNKKKKTNAFVLGEGRVGYTDLFANQLNFSLSFLAPMATFKRPVTKGKSFIMKGDNHLNCETWSSPLYYCRSYFSVMRNLLCSLVVYN